MVSYHYVYDYFHQSLSVDGDLDWLTMHYLGQEVDYDENHIVVVALPVSGQWQTSHEVHIKVFPMMS